MIKLKRLYSDPITFTEIIFKDGVNLILGERVEEEEVRTKKDRKTNGVGKSMCIEFINFCLLSSTTDSRVMMIPIDKLPAGTKFMLDLVVGSSEITIARTKEDPDRPRISENGRENIFNNLSDANEYLNKLLHSANKEIINAYPSFRQLLGPLIRKEGSEFKDLLKCYDIERNFSIPDLLIPHLYFFKIDFTIVEQIKKTLKNIEDLAKYINGLERDLTENKAKKISQVKAEVHSLQDDLEKIDQALQSFKTNEAYEIMRKELEEIDIEIEKLRVEQAAIRYEIKKIEALPKPEEVKVKDIEEVYSYFKDGLGEIVSKSLSEVIQFKKKIDEFQNKLFSEKLNTLKERLSEINKRLSNLELIHAEKISIIDQKGELRNLRMSFKVQNEKNSVYQRTITQLKLYEDAKRDLEIINLKREELFHKLNNSIYEVNNIIEDFNKTILFVHNYIMGNKKASFEIRTINSKSSKQIVEIELRIDDDGSHSIDRTKVFIYDLSLLFNKYTSERHPKFLIHDNILEVDQDTIVQSLNFLAHEEEIHDNFQYILTINRDRIQYEESQKLIKLAIKEHKVAEFTRHKKFLNIDYQEI